MTIGTSKSGDVSQRSILIVDDEADICRFLKSEFEMLGWLTHEVSDGVKAVETLNNQSFDLVLTDMRMPHMDGLSLLQSLRTANAKVPIVFMMSGFTDVTADSFLAAGANGVFSKPIDIDRLVAEIERMFAV